MPRHHRLDEHHRPTDRSLLRGGYEQAPPVSGKLLRLALLLLAVFLVFYTCLFLVLCW